MSVEHRLRHPTSAVIAGDGLEVINSLADTPKNLLASLPFDTGHPAQT